MISQVESDVKYSFWFTIFCHTTSIWESKQNLVHFLAKCGPCCQKNKVKQVSFDIVVFLYDILERSFFLTKIMIPTLFFCDK